jgi:S1-C subfamily serine protease
MNNLNRTNKSINYSIVRIIADDIDFNWNIPYNVNEPKKGQGTGFFIDSQYILTCCHVVCNSKNVYIEIPSKDSNKYFCNIISICPFYDIALLKTIDYKSKYYLKLGNSQNIKIGSKVEVVGYPVSKKNKNNSNNLKFTSGIISGQQDKYIQTDSSINPGNSGGPLFCNNKVIGINTSKLVGANLENIGFSVPIHYYNLIKKDMFENKIVFRPHLLIEYNNTNEQIIKELTNGKINKGIVISKIYDESILKKSNLTKNSILTKINNYTIDCYGFVNKKWLNTNLNINTILNEFKNNQKITITYYNYNIKNKCTIQLKPFESSLRIFYPIFEKIDYIVIAGMIIMNLTKNHLDKDNIKLNCYFINKENKYDKPALIISNIFPNTNINILNNIKQNDIITKVNNKNVHNLETLKNALKHNLIINKKEYILIENIDEKSVLLSKDDIIKENLKYSEIYKYSVYKNK